MIVKSSKILAAKTRTGKNKYWQCHIVKETHEWHGDTWYTSTEYWQEGSVHQTSTPYECKPKNVGKKNEVSAEEQAQLEFDSIVKKQKDKGYKEEGEEVSALPLPMLAQKFTERKHKIIYPAYVQPKYNGMRMLYDGTKAWSRGGKLIIPEVIKHLEFDTQGHITDGELILPDNPKLQETMKAAKKYRPGVSDKLLYVIYDVIMEEPFSKRRDWIADFFWSKNLPENVILAPTRSVNCEADIMEYHKEFIANGYEGIIIRNDDEGYCAGQRSNQLQKYKTMQDAEWLIVGVREGEGSYKGCATFQCVTAEGVTFECNPEGSIEHKKQLYKDRSSLINKFLTIRYQELSNDKVPLFPVGVEIRDPEDFK